MTKLQIRTDTESNRRKFFPLNAEPFWDKTENRAYHGELGSTTKGGVVSMAYPNRTQNPFGSIWQIHWYGANGAQPGARIMPTNEIGVLQRYATGRLPALALFDGGKAVIEVNGFMTPGSMRPRLIFAPSYAGQVLKPAAGTYTGAPTYGDYGIEISYNTLGENCLAGYDGDIYFDAKFEIQSLGGNAAGPDPVNGTDGNVLVTYDITWGKQHDHFLTSQQNAFPRLYTWRPNRALAWVRGDRCVANGQVYLCLEGYTPVAETGFTAQEYVDEMALRQPGLGIEWQQWWLPVRSSSRGQFVAEVDHLERTPRLDLDVGGAYQGDVNEVYLDWVLNPSTAGGSYPSFYAAEAEDGLVKHSGVDYIARIGIVNGGQEPGVGATWNKSWRVLSQRHDDITVCSSRAYYIGGRVGHSQKIMH